MLLQVVFERNGCGCMHKSRVVSSHNQLVAWKMKNYCSFSFMKGTLCTESTLSFWNMMGQGMILYM